VPWSSWSMEIRGAVVQWDISSGRHWCSKLSNWRNQSQLNPTSSRSTEWTCPGCKSGQHRLPHWREREVFQLGIPGWKAWTGASMPSGQKPPPTTQARMATAMGSTAQCRKQKLSLKFHPQLEDKSRKLSERRIFSCCVPGRS